MLPFATVWMDLEKIMPREISQSEKDKYHDFTHMCNLRKKLNKLAKQRQNHRCRADNS